MDWRGGSNGRFGFHSPFGINFLPQGIPKPLILRLLAERPMHGCVIMEHVGERTGGSRRSTPASIYPTMARLEGRGHITETVTADCPGGEKAPRPHALTPKGRSALKNHERFRDQWTESLSRMQSLWW